MHIYHITVPHLSIHSHAASLLSKFLIILRSTKGHLWQKSSPSITSPQVIRFFIHFARSNVGHHSQYHPKYLLCVKCYIKPYHDISTCNPHSHINSSQDTLLKNRRKLLSVSLHNYSRSCQWNFWKFPAKAGFWTVSRWLYFGDNLYS